MGRCRQPPPTIGLRTRHPAVVWLIDLLLVVAGLVLWIRACNEDDEAWSLFLRSVALLDLAFIAFGNGQMLIEIPLLALALVLPSAASVDKRRP